MVTLIIGLILLAIPFLFVEFFNDKKRGFVYILFFSIVFHTLLAFLTQIIGIFYYQAVAAATIVASIVLIIKYFKNKPGRKTPLKIFKPKIDWISLIVISIAFFTLYQVHYNYTGKINIATDETVSYHEVKNMRYVYPYYSDEWYAVSLIKYSINSHSLPIKSVLINKFFLNFELFFHSLTAELMLILGLNPLTQYALISIFINILIIVLAYIFLRLNNISKLAAGISSLSILYITCGANLPGIWHLLPINFGIVFFLLGLCFMTFNSIFMAFSSSFLVLLFYPPLFIFSALALATFFLYGFLKKKNKDISKIINYSAIALSLIILALFIILLIFPLTGFANYIFSKFFYISFTGFNMPQLNFYNIIPVPVILLAILGVVYTFKDKKYLFAPFLLGVFYWFFYSLTVYRIVIEYERVVFFTSVIIALIFGFGLERAAKFIDAKIKNTKYPISKYIEIGTLLLFLLLTPFYTQREDWRKLILIDPRSGVKSFPKSPANNYLTDDDLRIFKDIKGKNFLSIPWKGTVISIATNNYPIVTKEGTISVGPEETVDAFLSSNCEEKKKLAKKFKIDYIYINDFNCLGFEEIDKSREGLVLYKVAKN